MDAELVFKVKDGKRPHVVDLMEKDQIHFVLNTTSDGQSIKDSRSIRRTSLLRDIFYCTTLSAARAAVGSLRDLEENEITVCPIQLYHSGNFH